MRRLITAVVFTQLAVLAMVLVPSVARAATGKLVVGMSINIGGSRCSLGFFGTNDDGDRLAVTAGHCATDVDQVVTADNGVILGSVVGWRKDGTGGASIAMNEQRGYTIIKILNTYSIEAFFKGIDSTVEVGEAVWKFGQRTDRTQGTITKIRTYDDGDPMLLESDVVVLAGDSGGPWVNSSQELVGLSSSGNQEDSGGAAGSQGQPISDVLRQVKKNKWGAGFKVYIED